MPDTWRRRPKNEQSRLLWASLPLSVDCPTILCNGADSARLTFTLMLTHRTCLRLTVEPKRLTLLIRELWE